MKTTVFLVCLGAFVWLAGCGDDSTTTPTPPDYYKGMDKLGNYWVYQGNQIDTNGVVQKDSVYTDSMWVAGLELYNGRNASKMITMTTDNSGMSYDTSYISRSGDSIFIYTTTSIGGIAGDTSTPTEAWVLASNLSATAEWTAIPTVTRKTKQDIPFNGNTVTADISMSFGGTGAKLADSTLVCADTKSYSTKHFVVKPVISGSITALGGLFNQNITFVGGGRHVFFADGLGFIAERMEPSTISVGALFTSKQPGSIKTLLRYKIQ